MIGNKVKRNTWNEHINFEIYTPLSHWGKGATLMPSPANVRVARLLEYKAFFDGAYPLDYPKPIQFNWHRTSATFFADMMTSVDIEINSASSERFKESLRRAAYDAIIDMIRFGTALIRIQRDELGFAEAVCVEPIFWFPYGPNDDVLIEYSEEMPEINMYIDYHSNGIAQVEHRVYRNDKLTLGNQIRSQTFPVGTEAQWRSINEQTYGRMGMIVPFLRSPVTGDWGSSLYPEITSQAVAYSEQLTADAIALDDFRKAPWAGIPAEGAVMPSDDGDKKSTYSAIREKAEQDELDRWANEYKKVKRLPLGYSDVVPMQPNLEIGQSVMYADLLSTNLTAASSLPARLFGIAPNTPLATGEAIKWEYAKPRIAVHALTERMVDGLKACDLRGCMLESKALESEVIWPNFFDEMIASSGDSNASRPSPPEGEEAIDAVPDDEELEL